MWLASPKKDHSNCKRKAKLPSGGAGKGILWPENDGKEIRKYGQVESIGGHLKLGQYIMLITKKMMMEWQEW